MRPSVMLLYYSISETTYSEKLALLSIDLQACFPCLLGDPGRVGHQSQL